MRTKKQLKLRQIGKRYMIVEVSETEVNLTRVFSLNGTAAWLWQQAEGRDFTPEELVERLCEEYEVEATEARSDVERTLAEWKEMGLLE